MSWKLGYELARSTRKLKQAALAMIPVVSPAWGRVLLSKQQTAEVLKPFEVYSRVPPPVFLPSVTRIGVTPPLLAADKRDEGSTVRFRADSVWCLSTGGRVKDLRILSTGSVVLDGKFHLDLDFTPVKGLILSHKLLWSEDALIACWPHGWGSYYDFVMNIVTKLVRIEHALGPSVWKKARLAYPRRHAAYERDFLQGLGIDEDRVIDTRSFSGAAGASQIVVANNQRTRFYPSPHDICRLRDRFAPLPAGKVSRRLYISRAGTRRVVNESELRPILDRFGIDFVEDVSRPLREQIELFGAASLVVGPHGAAFTNIVWTPPGATVLELFNCAYFPPHFYYLAQVLGHDYGCWIQPGGGAQNDASRYDDLCVDPTGLIRLLEKAVSNSAAEMR